LGVFSRPPIHPTTENRCGVVGDSGLYVHKTLLGIMENHLEDNDFFVVGHYSVTDIALYAYTHVANEGASILRTSRQSACGWSASRGSLDTYR
jgi:hypothetical protein